MPRELLVSPDADALAADVSERFIDRLRAVQGERDRARIALTAGGIMERVWAVLAAHPHAGRVDWSRVDVFWGDERFVPANTGDRNDAPAERILFGREPFSAATRHSMPPSDGAYGDDLDAAAAGYAETLRNAVTVHDTGVVPNFDVVLLGVGPDGHCCSLFPEHPSSRDPAEAVIAVRNSPKPPPLRISLSFAGLNSAREIWVVASGSGKAEAVARALSGDYPRTEVPSGGAAGRDATRWLVDADAAAEVPGHGR